MVKGKIMHRNRDRNEAKFTGEGLCKIMTLKVKRIWTDGQTDRDNPTRRVSPVSLARCKTR